MDRCAVLVDAGYLLGAASTALTGEKSDRSRLRPDHSALIDAVRSRAEDETGMPVLRIYWYDAAVQRQPTAEHRALRALPDVKVRLGNLVARDEGPPQQKGVDAELHADLVTLARNRAVADIVLVSGDEDLCCAVETAQEYGVRVYLWAVGAAAYVSNQSAELIATADRRAVLDVDWISRYIILSTPPVSSASSASPVSSLPVLPSAARDPAVLRGSVPRGTMSLLDTAAVPVSTDSDGDAPHAADGAACPGDPVAGDGVTRAGGVGGAPASVDPEDIGWYYGRNWCHQNTPEQYEQMSRNRPHIEGSVDRDLLRHAAGQGVDTWTDQDAKYAVRAGFWRGIDFARDANEIGLDLGQ